MRHINTMLQPCGIFLIVHLILVGLPSSQGAKVKCYSIFGDRECFSKFINTLGKLPESPQTQAVRFRLFTTRNEQRPQYLNGWKSTTIASSNFNSTRPTRIIIHGFRDYPDKPWVRSMTRELLRRDGSNVIVVDWKKGADKSFLKYLQAAANTRVVGAMLAKIITIISTNQKIPYSRFHLIGHSLGAHIAGYAGRRLSGKIGRISGLDPAAPAFGNFNTKVRLDQSDAIFVDVIHTDGGFAGIKKPIGDADFFPNGGKKQPGCKLKFSDFLKSFFTNGLKELQQVPIDFGIGYTSVGLIPFSVREFSTFSRFHSSLGPWSQYVIGDALSGLWKDWVLQNGVPCLQNEERVFQSEDRIQVQVLHQLSGNTDKLVAIVNNHYCNPFRAYHDCQVYDKVWFHFCGLKKKNV